MHSHTHTHNNLFPWHTREENRVTLAKGRSMELCGLMVWKRWAEEGGILYWDLTSIVENWPQLHSATHIQQKKKAFLSYNCELQTPESLFNCRKLWVQLELWSLAQQCDHAHRPRYDRVSVGHHAHDTMRSCTKATALSTGKRMSCYG